MKHKISFGYPKGDDRAQMLLYRCWCNNKVVHLKGKGCALAKIKEVQNLI